MEALFEEVHFAAQEDAVVSSCGLGQMDDILELRVLVDLLQKFGGKVGDRHCEQSFG